MDLDAYSETGVLYSCHVSIEGGIKLLTNEEARKLPSAGKIVDLANYLSIVRTSTANQLAERYDVSRATIFRYLNVLYDVLNVPFVNKSGIGIRVENGWWFGRKQLEDFQIKALNRAIEETDDDQQKEDLRSIF